MADSSVVPPLDNHHDVTEITNDLDQMVENMELISVQLTWMAYDMVVLRTSPELEASLVSLQEAHQRCRAAVLAGEEPHMDASL